MESQNNSLDMKEFDENSVIEFPEGMLGLPEFKHYVIVESPSIKPFLRLQCVGAPHIGFLTIDPAFVDPGYKQFIVDHDPEHLYIDAEEDIVILVVCTVSRDGTDVTANLTAPVIINHKNMIGRQIILLESHYDIKHSLIDNARRQEA